MPWLRGRDEKRLRTWCDQTLHGVAGLPEILTVLDTIRDEVVAVPSDIQTLRRLGADIQRLAAAPSILGVASSLAGEVPALQAVLVPARWQQREEHLNGALGQIRAAAPQLRTRLLASGGTVSRVIAVRDDMTKHQATDPRGAQPAAMMPRRPAPALRRQPQRAPDPPYRLGADLDPALFQHVTHVTVVQPRLRVLQQLHHLLANLRVEPA